jgi:mannose-6-phosphate isomerase-like protein (cupin superfamily)
VEFIANDGCRIRELLHPKNDPVALPYSLAICRVEPLGRTHRHRLGATEVYYILGGRGRLWTEGDAVELGVGDAAVVPALAAQWIENPGAEELRFAVLVSPPWALDQDQRLE